MSTLCNPGFGPIPRAILLFRPQQYFLLPSSRASMCSMNFSNLHEAPVFLVFLWFLVRICQAFPPIPEILPCICHEATCPYVFSMFQNSCIPQWIRQGDVPGNGNPPCSD